MILSSFVSLGGKSNFVLLLCCWIADHKMEQVSQLASLIEAANEYHSQSCKILEELFGKLQKRWERQHSTDSAVHPVGELQFYSVHIKASTLSYVQIPSQ